MLKNGLFIFLIFFCLSATGQNALPDSLESWYVGVARDSVFVDELNARSLEYLKTNPTVARQVATHAGDVASRIRYPEGYARSLLIVGNSYWYEGIYEFAQNYYLLAARQYQAMKDSVGLGQAYNNIGEVYKRLDEDKKALEYLLRADQFKQKDSAAIALTFHNIAELYLKLNDVERAMPYINKSFGYAKRSDNKRLIAYNYWNFATLYKLAKEYDRALEFYILSENLWDDIGETRALIQTYQDKAEIYRITHRYNEAEKNLEKAIALASKIMVPDLQVKNYRRFALLDSMRGNNLRAYYYLNKHTLLKDSVYNLLKAEQIARLQTIYETEERANENQQLRTEKALRESQLAFQKISLVTVSIILIAAAVVSWILYRQRRRILFQKDAIESQATALLKLNDELQNLNRTLEARIDERTSQLSLQNTRLAEFTFINAHKLRAPVASILGLINLMTEVKESEKPEILTHLRKCSEELDNTIRTVSKNLEEAIVKEGKV
ncbi:MAG TPA: tetratricopeptide repeat protein [Chryseosolibacter sp.]|nr:tetratricopeptide repeat protein [Chryseosolibacter sp.]